MTGVILITPLVQRVPLSSTSVNGVTVAIAIPIPSLTSIHLYIPVLASPVQARNRYRTKRKIPSYQTELELKRYLEQGDI
jgi:hypothetical protein